MYEDVQGWFEAEADRSKRRALADDKARAGKAKLEEYVKLKAEVAALGEEQVNMTVVLNDGRSLNRFIRHAVGSIEVPMSDRALETKFADLAEGILPHAQARRLIEACWKVEDLADAAELVRLGTRT